MCSERMVLKTRDLVSPPLFVSGKACFHADGYPVSKKVLTMIQIYAILIKHPVVRYSAE